MSDQLKQLLTEFQSTLDTFSEVRYAGDPVLRQMATEVSVDEGTLIGRKLGDVLMRYRAKVGYGRGFAAPQIGESKTVFVTFVDDKLEIFINPKIVERSQETNFYRELCLSCGMMSVDVERSEWIVMDWVDASGKKHSETIHGFLARLYQHEEAHLRGLLNLDEASSGAISFALFDPLKEQLRQK